MSRWRESEADRVQTGNPHTRAGTTDLNRESCRYNAAPTTFADFLTVRHYRDQGESPTGRGIDEAFESLAREKVVAVFVTGG